MLNEKQIVLLITKMQLNNNNNNMMHITLLINCDGFMALSDGSNLLAEEIKIGI